MVKNDWLIVEKEYSAKKELYWETIFSLSNGTMAARGTLEEGHACPEIRSYFGNYVAGIFDKYKKDYQAIVVQPDFFDTVLSVNGALVKMSDGRIEAYHRTLNMYDGTLTREFIWKSPKGEMLSVVITRLICRHDPHLAVLRYKLTPLNFSGNISFQNTLDANVANIDFHVSGYQLRDEKYYFIDERYKSGTLKGGGYLSIKTKTTQHQICHAFACEIREGNNLFTPSIEVHKEPRLFRNFVHFYANEGREYEFTRWITQYADTDPVNNLLESCTQKINEVRQKL